MSSTTCELDIIPTKFLKKVLSHCIPAITKVVNLSLSTGHFFEDWKLAIVRPLIKSQKKGTEKSNYRPVSNLQFISKVVEKCTLNQLTDHCNKHNLLPEYQSAYRKHYSCETSLLKLVNDTLWAMEDKRITAVTVMDLSVACDTVSHELLLAVLRERFGINNLAITWYENYLKPRHFKVSINGKYSAQKTMDFSVPQGSTQGAYLFICYASTLNEIVPKSLTLNGFADDHSIRKSFRPTAPINNSSSAHSEEDDTITIMQNSMLDIKSWMDAVKLKLNETKTEFIYFGGKQQLAKTRRNTININGETIQCTNKIKYLGGHLDSSLTLKDHIIAKSKAATINIIKIRNIRKYLNQDICHKLVISLVLSHLDYSNSLLSGLPDSSINILQKVQNSEARLVLGRNAKYSSTENTKQLHWLPIKQYIDYKVLTLVHKCLHQKAPNYLQDLLNKKVAKRQGLRSEEQVLLEVPCTKNKTFASHSFSVYAPTKWNKLPNTIRNEHNFDKFKKMLKTHLFNQAYNQ